MKAIYLSKLIAVSTLLFAMTFLSSCKDSENSIENRVQKSTVERTRTLPVISTIK